VSNNQREEIKNLERLADAANERMNRFQAEVAAALTDIAFKHFEEMQDMDAAFIRQFGSMVSSHTWRITEDMDRLHHSVKKQ